MFWGSRNKNDKARKEALVSELLTESYPSPPEKKPIEIILVLTNTGATEQDAKTISRICEIAYDHKAMTLCLNSTLSVFTYGMVESVETAGSRRMDLVRHLTTELGKTIAVVHGKALAWVGLIGDEKHVISYSFLAPNYREALTLVSTAPLGSVVEFDFGNCN